MLARPPPLLSQPATPESSPDAFKCIFSMMLIFIMYLQFDILIFNVISYLQLPQVLYFHMSLSFFQNPNYTACFLMHSTSSFPCLSQWTIRWRFSASHRAHAGKEHLAFIPTPSSWHFCLTSGCRVFLSKFLNDSPSYSRGSFIAESEPF